jgi:hypothetical protein
MTVSIVFEKELYKSESMEPCMRNGYVIWNMKIINTKKNWKFLPSLHLKGLIYVLAFQLLDNKYILLTINLLQWWLYSFAISRDLDQPIHSCLAIGINLGWSINVLPLVLI